VRASTSGYVDVGPVELYYERHGRGRPMVLLHGAMGTIESCFTGLLPALVDNFEVFAVELQGHGHTADVDRRLAYDLMAQDVGRFVGELGLGPVDIVGYSMGGAVALELARHQPTLVRRLVWFGGVSYRREGLHPEMLGDMGDMVSALEGSVWQQAYQRVAPRPQDWPQLVLKVGELDATFPGWSEDQVRAIAHPLLLIVGDADIVRLEHVVDMFHLLGGGVLGDLAGIPPARLAVLPGTSHVGILERTAWLESMINDFLEASIA